MWTITPLRDLTSYARPSPATGTDDTAKCLVPAAFFPALTRYAQVDEWATFRHVRKLSPVQSRVTAQKNFIRGGKRLTAEAVANRTIFSTLILNPAGINQPLRPRGL